jgi:F-type H+-transporting ATPase subunit delta
MKISVKQYSQTLFDLTDGKSEQEILGIVSKFAELLKKDGQLKNSQKIMDKFSAIYNDAHQIVEARVISARELSVAQITDVKEFVKKKYLAKDVVIENAVNEKVRGGLIIKVRDEVIDGSVVSQLKRLKNELMK